MKYKLIGNNDKNNIIETILLNRGVKNPNEYLNLDESCINDYNNLSNINKAVECFSLHFDRRDNIAILVDCDPDGYTSAALIYKYIKDLDDSYPVHYIIHKNSKAHGLSSMGIGDFKIPDNVKLLIIPDAGTNDCDECNSLLDNGCDCIILDHHQAEDMVYINRAIIVNNQMSDSYTCKSFSGVGMAYEFARALDDYFVCVFADKYLDLVAFGNISDVMSVTDYQTRYYIEQGIQNINNKFLLALNQAQEFSTKGNIHIHNIAWYWTPICNAMIRIGSFEDRDMLFRAFIETDEVFPYTKRGSTEIVDEDIYTRVARLCKNIKSRQDKLRNELCDELIEDVNQSDKIAMVVAEHADPGIIGLSCARIADLVQKPCIVLRERSPGIYGGSCRNCRQSSVPDFKSLVSSTGLFSLVAGHNNAFGVEICEENLEDAFYALNEAMNGVETDTTIYCDFLMWESEVDVEFVKAIDDSMWLYGTELEEPIVVVEGICIDADECYAMGANQDSVWFMHNGIKFCRFKCKPTDDLLRFAIAGDGTICINIVAKCSMNEYKGVSTPQIIIEDYEIV